MPDPWPAETGYIVVHGDLPTDVRTGPFTLSGARSEQDYWARYVPDRPTRIVKAVTTYTVVERAESNGAQLARGR